MHLASKVDRSSALAPPFLLISYISATKNCAPSTHRKHFRLWKYSCYDFFHLRYLNCTAVWDCKNLQELREIGAEQGGEVNVLRFDQPWPLLLTFSYSLYTYIYTNILYILQQHFITGQVLRFDQLWPLLLTLRWLQQTLDYWGSIDISSTDQDLHHLTMLGIALCTLHEETIPSLFSEIKLEGII